MCGITPYDATHIGHAATYLAYDTLVRLWLDAGHEVDYVQNITDVDDPLLERAAATGVDWRELAAGQIDLFRGDMTALGMIPPTHYVAVTEVIDSIAAATDALLETGFAYRLGADVYFDAATAAAEPWHLGQESGLGRDEMLRLSAERGGDPDTPGKRDPLDPVLWRGQRAGEPSWPSVLGPGRPGWHIECSVIAQRFLGTPITVQGGGSDLVFPHHEFSAGHAAALTGLPLAGQYAHAGMVAYDGEKMSKSLGNLVLVSRLLEENTDPRAIRLALLSHHYRSDWEWTRGELTTAQCTLGEWEAWAAAAGTATETPLLAQLRDAVADDLDTPRAIAVVQAHIAGGAVATATDIATIDALLGITL